MGCHVTASTPMDTRNRGSVALASVVPQHGQKTALARELSELGGKVDNAMVGRWASGKRRPDPSNRRRLEELRQIPWTWWDESCVEDEEALPPGGGGDCSAR
jgi:hypothetical protein